MKILAEIIGGSRLYGTDTPSSDYDLRGVFINEEPSKILGLDRFDHQVKNTNEEDRMFYEVRRFLESLRKTNTQMMEILNAPIDKFTILDPLFKKWIINEKEKFFDTKKLFNCLRGYSNTERRKANGELPGDIGKKRMEMVEKYGYSPSNVCHFIRLTLTGSIFFERGEYLVDVKSMDKTMWELIMSIKEDPSSHVASQLDALMGTFEKGMVNIYEARDKSKDYKFDEDYANDVLKILYKPYLY